MTEKITEKITEKTNLKPDILDYFYTPQMVTIQKAVTSYISDLGKCPESTFWKLYLDQARNEKYHKELHNKYIKLKEFLDEFLQKEIVSAKNKRVLLDLTANAKAFKSALEKMESTMLAGDSLDSIKDFVGFKIVILKTDRSELDRIYDIHKIAVAIIKFFESEGYITCKGTETKDNKDFNPETHPDVVVPQKDIIKKILGKYESVCKNYETDPKIWGYQGLHILFKDEKGRYIELLLCTQEQNTRGKDVEECIKIENEKTKNRDVSDASHKKVFKANRPKRKIDWRRLNVEGVVVSGCKVDDTIGFCIIFTIYKNTIIAEYNK